jgi:hypothetical protein
MPMMPHHILLLTTTMPMGRSNGYMCILEWLLGNTSLSVPSDIMGFLWFLMIDCFSKLLKCQVLLIVV